MNEREKKLNALLDNLNDKLDKALALKARQKMGMSIDEAINHGQEQLEIFGGEHREFIETAIDTMRKYQKIQQILKDIPYGGDATVRRIQEVVDDGNDK